MAKNLEGETLFPKLYRVNERDKTTIKAQTRRIFISKKLNNYKSKDANSISIINHLFTDQFIIFA